MWNLRHSARNSKTSGLTLIELVFMVVSLILVAAVLTPYLRKTHIQNNESGAIGDLRAICGAQVAYASAYNAYATTFNALTSGPKPFLKGDWSGPRGGYRFEMGGSQDNFTCEAIPVRPDVTGVKFFFVDATGVIQFEEGKRATSASNPPCE